MALNPLMTRIVNKSKGLKILADSCKFHFHKLPFCKVFHSLTMGSNLHYGELGPREHKGAVDLINHNKLVPHHKFFCKRSLPFSILDTHYLHNVVGDANLGKGRDCNWLSLYKVKTF